MREIKFRAWSKISKDMFPVEQWANKSWVAIPVQVGEDDWELQQMRLEDVELMQYTGLKDKNGKEIYEGDVCKFYHHPEDVVVFSWDDELLSYKATVVSEGIYCEDYFQIKSDSKKYEIIGNIYENKDLLS